MEYLIRTNSIHGREYKIACYEAFPQHPSLFSFVDEADIRDRDWNIKDGAIVFDIGAAYGSYTLTALAQGAAHVFAWSPQGPKGEPSEAEVLIESLKLNGWVDKVTIVPGGLYSKTGVLNANTQKFYSQNETPVEDITGNEWLHVRSLDNWFRAEVGRIAQLLKSNPDIWFKLDVEGAEAHVLWGAAGFIKIFHPTIQVENHSFKDVNLPDRVQQVITSIGGYRHVHTIPYHAVSHSLYVGE